MFAEYKWENESQRLGPKIFPGLCIYAVPGVGHIEEFIIILSLNSALVQD